MKEQWTNYDQIRPTMTKSEVCTVLGKAQKRQVTGACHQHCALELALLFFNVTTAYCVLCWT